MGRLWSGLHELGRRVRNAWLEERRIDQHMKGQRVDDERARHEAGIFEPPHPGPGPGGP